MNKKIKYGLYELLELVSRTFRLRDEEDEHYKVLMNLIYFRCRDYMKLVDELDYLNVGEEE
jgi:hypothetical protein